MLGCCTFKCGLLQGCVWVPGIRRVLLVVQNWRWAWLALLWGCSVCRLDVKASDCSRAPCSSRAQGAATAQLWKWWGRAVPCLPAFPGSHIRGAQHADAISICRDAEPCFQPLLGKVGKLLECPWRRCRLIPFLAADIPCCQCKWALEGWSHGLSQL